MEDSHEIVDFSLPLNEYFIRSSHNTFGSKLFWDNRSHLHRILKFLNAGFRALEIDMYWDRKKRIKVGHHGLNFSFSRPSFKAYLNNIRKWQAVNPDHLPLFIQLEAHNPKNMKGLAEIVFEEVLEVFSFEFVFGPTQLRKFRRNNSASPWPSPDELRNRVIFYVRKKTIDAYNNQRKPGSKNYLETFFSNSDDYFADYDYLRLFSKQGKINRELQNLRKDIKMNKIVRVSTSYKLSLKGRKQIDIQKCMREGVNLIAVDDVNEGAHFFNQPYLLKSSLELER